MIFTRNKLLGARFQAFRETHGEYVLLLDSDQILEKSALERCVSMMEEYDMLALGELTADPSTYLQKLFKADRVMIDRIGSSHLDVRTGTMLPRFFRSSVLRVAFSHIPEFLFKDVVAHDHAIIYLEANRVSKRVGFVPESLYSHEPSRVTELWFKNFRLGRSMWPLLRSPYWNFVWTKTRLRAGRQGNEESSLSDLLLLMKGLPFISGIFVGGFVNFGKSVFGHRPENGGS